MGNNGLFECGKCYTPQQIADITGLSLWWVGQLERDGVIPFIRASERGDAPKLAEGNDLNEWYISRKSAANNERKLKERN